MTDRPGTPQPGPDGQLRCPWAMRSPEFLGYHDAEWGRPVRSDQGIFERLCLEGFQSGLSWLTILRKRENFRAAFRGFDLAQVAGFGRGDLDRLLGDAGIIRNRAKIEATIHNARAALDIPGGLAALVWSYRRTRGRSPRSAWPICPPRPPRPPRWPRSCAAVVSGSPARSPFTPCSRPAVWWMTICGTVSGAARTGGLPIALRESHRQCHNVSRA